MAYATTLLGVGDNAAFVYDRDGESIVADLTGQSVLRWERVLGGISSATVTVQTGGHGPAAACCNLLGDLHAWAHTLVIFRDGVRVWEGPIKRITYRRTEVLIDAVDMLGWLTRRIAQARTTGSAVSVVDEGQLLIERAFTDDDPNTVLTVYGAGAGAALKRDVADAQGYYDQDLNTLGSAGLRFTTVGRRIVLWPDTLTLGQTEILVPEEHLLSEIDVIEDGDELSTRSTAVNDTGLTGQYGLVTDPYFGQVEHLVQVTRSNTAGLASAAEADQKQHQPHGAVPMILQIPDDAQMSPNAPFPMANLVAGVIVPVTTAITCRRVSTEFVLSRMTVQQTAESEKVGISLIPKTGAIG